MSFSVVVPLAPGSRLHEYEVRSTLGLGGFGITYLCRDRNLLNCCVIKEFAPRGLVKRVANGDLQALNASAQNEFLHAKAEFLQEARRLALFNHPNIAKVNRFFEAHSTGYFTMTFEAGGTLRDLIAEKGNSFEDGEIAEVLKPLCAGVLELHKAEILHLDIKPDNVIIRPDGTPVLIDLGAAITTGGGGAPDERVVATPAYAPIEQLTQCQPLGPWTDVYSLGALLYEMISGRPPSPALRRARGEVLTDAVTLGRGRFSDRLLRLIDSALSMEPQERPQSIREFLRFFENRESSVLRGVIWDVSLKMVVHFSNWAKPNPQLWRDELVTFCVLFPAIDLAWRLGRGIPEPGNLEWFLEMMAPDCPAYCDDFLAKRGFTETRSGSGTKLIKSRVQEYGACYLLDRQQEEWTYVLVRKQLIRNCLAAPPPEDAAGFSSLMEEVIDRARGRVQRSLQKALQRVFYVKTSDGWIKQVREFGSDQQI